MSSTITSDDVEVSDFQQAYEAGVPEEDIQDAWDGWTDARFATEEDGTPTLAVVLAISIGAGLILREVMA